MYEACQIRRGPQGRKVRIKRGATERLEAVASTLHPDTQDTGSREVLAEESGHSHQPNPSSDNKLLWWPLALSETLKSDRPLGVSLGDRPMVLWRDAQGEPRAMIDQ